MSSLNSDFWEIVAAETGGNTTVTWRDLEVGEVFLLERGPVRQVCEVVSMHEDSFDCRLAWGKELPSRHKVLVIADD